MYMMITLSPHCFALLRQPVEVQRLRDVSLIDSLQIVLIGGGDSRDFEGLYVRRTPLSCTCTTQGERHAGPSCTHTHTHTHEETRGNKANTSSYTHRK